MDCGKVKIGISACLLGQPVRYDGGHRLDVFLRDTLGRYVEYVPVCPEAEAGFGIPREKMHLEGDPGAPGLVTADTRRDMTPAMVEWAEKRLDVLAGEDLHGFILKSRSPSCAVGGVILIDQKGEETAETASGIFAGMLMKRFPLLPVTDEARLGDPEMRESFFGRVFTTERWRALRNTFKRQAG